MHVEFEIIVSYVVASVAGMFTPAEEKYMAQWLMSLSEEDLLLVMQDILPEEKFVEHPVPRAGLGTTIDSCLPGPFEEEYIDYDDGVHPLDDVINNSGRSIRFALSSRYLK